MHGSSGQGIPVHACEALPAGLRTRGEADRAGVGARGEQVEEISRDPVERESPCLLSLLSSGTYATDPRTTVLYTASPGRASGPRSKALPGRTPHTRGADSGVRGLFGCGCAHPINGYPHPLVGPVTA